MQNVPAEGVVKVYINGELLGTLVWPESFSVNLAWKAYLHDSTGYGNYVRISSLHIAVKP
jgi:hypothetical protein